MCLEDVNLSPGTLLCKKQTNEQKQWHTFLYYSYLNPAKSLENLTLVFFGISPNLKYVMDRYGILNSSRMNHGLWSLSHFHQLIMRNSIRTSGSLSCLPLSIFIYYVPFLSGFHAFSESLPWTYYYVLSTFPIMFTRTLFQRQALCLCPVHCLCSVRLRKSQETIWAMSYLFSATSIY